MRIKTKVHQSKGLFFNTIAHEMNFQSSILNWQNIPVHHLLQKKGGRNILLFNKGSYKMALANAYPEFDWAKFRQKPGKWDYIENRRKFFDKIACSSGFNPLDCDQWYTISQERILQEKYAWQILKYYNKNYITALIEIYAELGLVRHRFNTCVFQSNRLMNDASYKPRNR